MNFFKNPLVLTETVLGKLIDNRAVVMYRQPKEKPADEPNFFEKALNFISAQYSNEHGDELFTGYTLGGALGTGGRNAAFAATYIDCEVTPTSDLCEHPVETGTVITDASIIQPVIAKVRVAMPTRFYTAIYDEIYKLFKDKEKIQLQTKYALYQNLVLVAFPHKLSNDNVDRAIFEFELKEVIEIDAQAIGSDAVAQISNKKAAVADTTDTQNLGRKTGA